MANVAVLNTTGQLSGKTIAICENDQTVTGAWTFSGNQSFTGNVTLGNAAGDTVTVNGTIVSNLIFTDATYDIGASGATRPRDLFLSRNLVIGGLATLAAGSTNGILVAGDAYLKANGSIVIDIDTNADSGGGEDFIVRKDAATTLFSIDETGEASLTVNVATPAGGSTAGRVRLGTTAAFGVYYGSGVPTVSAAQGSFYMRSDGSTTSTRAYINTDGGTTWTAITTAA